MPRCHRRLEASDGPFGPLHKATEHHGGTYPRRCRVIDGAVYHEGLIGLGVPRNQQKLILTTLEVPIPTRCRESFDERGSLSHH
jgi:hypothetical protein